MAKAIVLTTIEETYDFPPEVQDGDEAVDYIWDQMFLEPVDETIKSIKFIKWVE